MNDLSNVVELVSEHDLNRLIQLYTTDESQQVRLKHDFETGHFKALLHIDNDEITGYLIFNNAYSTWQHRTLFASDIWLKEGVEEAQMFSAFKSLFQKLFALARENFAKCINVNLNLQNQRTIEWIKQMGALNLSEQEDWLIFEMRLAEMQEFIGQPSSLNPAYKLVKVNDINSCSHEVRELINQLAIFEKLEEQCETTAAELTRDYELQGNKCKKRFYELSIAVKEETNELVGFAIYYMKYELAKGLGFYLEDLYIKTEYRGSGVGTCLWQFVVKDVLSAHEAKFMHWTVLEWNKPAIDFYYKYKSNNLTEVCGLNLFRFITDTIYNNAS